MALRTLSPFTYYGGKARMAPLICDMLDYSNTDIYIEPFGGAARVLLNKPRHKVEIYNDSSAGLCAFMRVMSNKNTSKKLIDRLYETEYSPEEFYRAMFIRNETEDHFIDELRRQAFLYVKQLILKYDLIGLKLLKENIQRKKIKEIAKSYHNVKHSNLIEKKEKEVLHNFYKQFYHYMKIYNNILERDYEEQLILNFNEFKDKVIKTVNKKILVYSNKLRILDSSNIKGIQALSKKIEKLGKMLFTIKNLSLKNVDSKTAEMLRAKSYKTACEIAYSETSNNHDNIDIDDMDLAVATYVIYSQSRDGMGKDWSSAKYKSTDDYHRHISILYDVAERLEGVHVNQVGALSYVLKCSYLDNKKAMIYCDPSYLKTEDEQKNLGTVYKDSFTYEDHEVFLKAIYKAKCKILISNYNTELYNKYLNEKNGWSCIEYKTTTSVGGKENNERVEVLWYNY